MKKIISSIIVFSIIGCTSLVLSFWGNDNKAEAQRIHEEASTMRKLYFGPTRLNELDKIIVHVRNIDNRPFTADFTCNDTVTGDALAIEHINVSAGEGKEIVSDPGFGIQVPGSVYCVLTFPVSGLPVPARRVILNVEVISADEDIREIAFDSETGLQFSRFF